MGFREVWSPSYPTSADPERVLLIKLIIAETGGGGGGSGKQQVYSGSGNPNGVVSITAATAGFPAIYIDNDTGQLYQKVDGLVTSTGWA